MLRKLFIVLILIQLLGYIGSIVEAMDEIKSIQASGPAFTAIGLVLAAFSYHRRLTFGLYFGLSIPTTAIFCLAIIVGFRLTPAETELPISGVLILCSPVIFILAGLAFYELIRSNLSQRGPGLRFSFSTFLGLIACIIVASGFVLTGDDLLSGVGILLVYGWCCGYILWNYHRRDKLFLAESDKHKFYS